MLNSNGEVKQAPKARARLTPEQELELMNQAREIKKHLKKMSKNQLIQALLMHVNILTEQKSINKILIERLKEAEGKTNEVK